MFRPHASVSAAGPTDVVHLLTSRLLCPTMEVTRNKKVVFLLTSLGLKFRPDVQGNLRERDRDISISQGEAQPGFATCFPPILRGMTFRSG